MNKLISFTNLFNNCIDNNHTIVFFDYSKTIHTLLKFLEKKRLIRAFFVNSKNQIVLFIKKDSDRSVIRRLKYIPRNFKYNCKLKQKLKTGLFTNSCFGTSITNEYSESNNFLHTKHNFFLKDFCLLIFLN